MTEVVAHRGLHHSERENTLDAFWAARALGVDGVEFDVRRCADGALVIHHDPTIDGRAIATTDAVDLPGYVPTLEAALEACEGLRVNVEIKNYPAPSEPHYDPTGSLAREVLAALRHAGWAERALVSCFDPDTCAAVRAADPDIAVGWLLVPGADLVDALERAVSEGFDALNPHYLSVSAAGVAAARGRGVDLNVWTVNAEADLRAQVGLGVTSVITDDPALALAVVAEVEKGRP